MSKAPQTYFTNSLNYTLANEDTALELALLPAQVNHLFCVAGSGGRVLPLLAKAPKNVTCVDLSQEQLYLTELRIESVRAMNRDEFLAFWGYPPRSASAHERHALFNRTKLSPKARHFFEAVFEQLNWETLLYEGKWEKTFKRLSQINRLLTGTKGLGLFSALNDQEHNEYLRTHFPKKAWGAVLALVGNAGMFNALLYKGAFPKKNIPLSFYKFYEIAFDRLFSHGPVRANFFLQLVFFGRVVFEDGLPIECSQDVFVKAKEAIKTANIRYVKGDLIQAATTSNIPIDFISLSDVPSYFTGETEKTFLSQIAQNLTPGALAVLRNYLHLPEGLDSSDYDIITDRHRDLITAEKVGVYSIEIYRRKP